MAGSELEADHARDDQGEELRRNGFRRFTESRHADDPRAGGSKDNANTDWKANTHEEGQRGVRSGSERRRYSLRCAFVTFLLFHEPAAPMLRDHMFAVAPPILA